MSSKSFCFIEILSYTFLTSEFSGKNPKTRFQSKAISKTDSISMNSRIFRLCKRLPVLPKPTQPKKRGLSSS
ncbi:hypothetical protein DQM68_09320 [Leptospira mayottensis]|uniref:Uncharacterized protein n=1 Tax=Leptospira mayottensis TaxID=1137606 RepID=A0ABN5NWC0_9LEPT|nr:hypothetical protein DQM68_09320 [Leptospira mayottensis]AXR64732.1 hypothetical protein DQM28_11405 [Leptospira mayottensis]AXR68435.1 hypothetical protein DPV73_10790 [Leptospira mayottensis]AZQ03827.1 hypothetical protein LEP1GSC190_12370 [Leptospira mayottensis 200901116]TGM99995.1 hypothetical protein EHR03_13585 [Leptospira mayottensis]